MKRDTIQSTNNLSRVAIITRNYYNTGGKQIDYFGAIKSKNVIELIVLHNQYLKSINCLSIRHFGYSITRKIYF